MNSKNLLIIFTRNPKLGKVKTRLAKSVGNKTALDIYHFLLQKTKEVTKNISCDKKVYYSEKITENDLWNRSNYQKREQFGSDLGEKMKNAFDESFKNNYEKVIVIGSDLFDLKAAHIENAFKALENHNLVIGPSLDGGYYLLGMKVLHPAVFKNKQWGTDSVLETTLKNLEQENVKLLEALNDIDTFEDLKDQPELIKNIKL